MSALAPSIIWYFLYLIERRGGRSRHFKWEYERSTDDNEFFVTDVGSVLVVVFFSLPFVMSTRTETIFREVF